MARPAQRDHRCRRYLVGIDSDAAPSRMGVRQAEFDKRTAEVSLTTSLEYWRTTLSER